MKYLRKCNMFFCKNTSLLTGGNSTHKTSVGARTGIVRCPDGHRPVPGRASSGARTGIGRFVKRFLKVPGACQTSYDAQPGTVRCPDGHRWNRTI